MIGLRRVLVGALLVLGLSCQLVVGLDRPHADPPIAEAAAAVDPCAHALPPSPPDAAGESTESMHFWFAGRQVIVPLTPDAGVKEGLDLDDSCTCQHDLDDGGPSCTIQGSADVCDYDGGIDDSVTAVSARFPVGDLFDPGGAVNRLVAEGSETILIYLERYNGTANDSDVGVAVMTAGGLFSDFGCDDQPRGRPSRGRPTADAPADQWAPAWDGCDRWTPEPGKTINDYPNVQPVSTLHGYVSGGVAFAAIDTFGLTILGSASRIQAGKAIARIVPVGQGFELHGFLTGRLPFTDLVDLVGRNEIGVGNPLCASPLWPSLTAVLCGARDIMADQSRDHKGEPCDAASVAMGFDAFPARVASGTYSRPARVLDCDAAVTCP